jgi:hypothetical protein
LPPVTFPALHAVGTLRLLIECLFNRCDLSHDSADTM